MGRVGVIIPGLVMCGLLVSACSSSGEARQDRPGGTDRLFKTRATMISGSSATVTTCDDGSRLEEVNPGTGVPDPAYNAPADQQYLFETWQMVRLGSHWAVSAVSPVTLPDSRAEPCQPLPTLPAADLAGAAGEQDSTVAVVVPQHPVAGQQPATTPADRHALNALIAERSARNV
jgi:hypothetical protein